MIGVLEPNNFPLEAVNMLERLGPVLLGERELATRAKSIEGLFCRLGTFLGHDHLERFEGLKWVASPTTALSHLDLSYLQKRGVRVYSLRDLDFNELNRVTSTAELTVFLMLAVTRNFLKVANDPSSLERWDRYSETSKQLSSRKVGVIGVGRIGRRVYECASALGAQTLGFDIRDISSDSFKPNMVHSLKELMIQSDVVIVCATYDPLEGPILSEEVLQFANQGLLLVNTARGELVDEEAIENLMRNGTLAGYATDVISGEPKAEFRQSPIFRLLDEGYNVVVTPHVGGAASDALQFSELALATYVTDAQISGLQ